MVRYLNLSATPLPRAGTGWEREWADGRVVARGLAGTGALIAVSLTNCCLSLTLRLLISYIYGAPSKTRNANVVYIYGPTFGNAGTVSFDLLRNVSTLNQCREVSCVTFVCKHFAS